MPRGVFAFRRHAQVGCADHTRTAPDLRWNAPMTPLQTLQLHEAAVRRLAGQFAAHAGSSVDREDLAQDGFLALLEMQIDDTQPELQRHAYVEQRMRGAMLDSLRATDPCPRQVRRTLRAIAQAEAHLTALNGGRPTDAEIAAEAGVPLEKYFAARHAAHVTTPAAAPDEGFEDRVTVDELFLAQHARSATGDPADLATQAELRRRVAAALDTIPARLRHILLARMTDRTLREIAGELGVTESRVCQLQKEAIRRLREALK
jgi:RNA polymerase sigma factor for flagellar operon FliA